MSLEPPLTELRKALRTGEPTQATAVPQGREEIARIVKATIDALQQLRDKKDVAEMRGVDGGKVG